MSLREQFNEQIKEAMKAKHAKRLSTLRMVTAALKDRDIAARTETSRELLGDDEILTLLAKMIKQREESASPTTPATAPNSPPASARRSTIIRAFMPKQMSAEETKAAAQAVVAETGAAAMKDMGKVMAVMKERFAGQMDFAKASAMVKDILSGK